MLSSTQATILYNEFENYTFEITVISPRGNALIVERQSYVLIRMTYYIMCPLECRHNERDGVSIAQPFVHAQIKENMKAPCHWSLWWESTGD